MADATQEKSWASFHRLVDKAIIKMDEISQPCTDFFLMELFQILMDKKWHPSQTPSIKHPPLDKQDYQVLAYVAGAAITWLQRRLPAGPKAVVSSMAANDDTCDSADHVQLTRDLTRGGLKMVRRETCDLMAAMELLFQEQCSMKCFQRDTYVKKCCSVQPLFLDCISEGFSDADIEKAFEAFVTFFSDAEPITLLQSSPNISQAKKQSLWGNLWSVMSSASEKWINAISMSKSKNPSIHISLHPTGHFFAVELSFKDSYSLCQWKVIVYHGWNVKL